MTPFFQSPLVAQDQHCRHDGCKVNLQVLQNGSCNLQAAIWNHGSVPKNTSHLESEKGIEVCTPRVHSQAFSLDAAANLNHEGIHSILRSLGQAVFLDAHEFLLADLPPRLLQGTLLRHFNARGASRRPACLLYIHDCTYYISCNMNSYSPPKPTCTGSSHRGSGQSCL